MKKLLIFIFVFFVVGCDSSPKGKTYLVATDATLVFNRRVAGKVAENKLLRRHGTHEAMRML